MGDAFIHPSSYVDSNVMIGENTAIWHFCHIQEGAVIGKNCRLGQNVNISNNVKIGNGVFCGPSMVFTNDLLPRSKYPKGQIGYQKTVVREQASIGANATVVCGHEIGKCAMIAAGAVVTSDVPSYALMAGIPARQIGWVCECGNKLDAALECGCCKAKYMQIEYGLKKVSES